MLFCLMGIVSTAQVDEYDAEMKAYRDSTWRMDFHFTEKNTGSVNESIVLQRLDSIKRFNDSLLAFLLKENIRLRSDSLMALYNYLQKDRSRSYNSWNWFVTRNLSDPGSLAPLLEKYGYPAWRTDHYDVSFFLNFTWKRRFFVHDVFFALPFGREQQNDSLSISYNTWRPLHYSFGLSVLNSKYVDIFPFGALSLQMSDLTFKPRLQSDPAPLTKLEEMLPQIKNYGVSPSLTLDRTDVLFDYGAEIDFHVAYSPAKAGLILGIRAGRCLSLTDGSWHKGSTAITGLDDVILRDSYVSLILKIYWRRTAVRYEVMELPFQ